MIDSLSDNEKHIIEVVLLIVILLLVLIVYKVSLIKKEKNTVKNINDSQLVVKEINKQDIKQEELEQIIDEQLFILMKKNSISEITNQNKLSLALTMLNKNNNMFGYSNTFTKEELEDSFNKTCISNLGLIHENIIATETDAQDGNPRFGYIYSDGIYGNETAIEKNFMESKIISKKVISFNSDDKYTISIGYLWSEPVEDVNNITKIYGKNNEELITVPENVLSLSGDRISNITNWINENYDKFSDKLDIYNYVFTRQNNKIVLVDFYKN